MLKLTVETMTFKAGTNWSEIQDMEADRLLASIDIEDDKLVPVKEIPPKPGEDDCQCFLTRDVTLRFYNVDVVTDDDAPEEDIVSWDATLEALRELVGSCGDAAETRYWFHDIEEDGEYWLHLTWEDLGADFESGYHDYDLAYVGVEKIEEGDKECQACHGWGEVRQTGTLVEFLSRGSWNWEKCDACGGKRIIKAHKENDHEE